MKNIKPTVLFLFFVLLTYGQQYSPTLYSNGPENKITFEKGFLKVNFSQDLFIHPDKFEIQMMAFEDKNLLGEEDELYAKENLELLIQKYKEQVKTFRDKDFGSANSFFVAYQKMNDKYQFYVLHKFVDVRLGFGNPRCIGMKNSEFQINRKNFFVLIIVNDTLKSFYQIQPNSKGNPVYKINIKDELILML